MRLLLVEDDEMFGEATKNGLEQEAHAVDWARNAEEALTALKSQPYDMVLLDLGLPDREGTDILRRLRKTDNHLPVLIMTARDSVDDKINGLDTGADDYLVKPFDLHELFARIRAVHRRLDGHQAPASTLSYGPVVLDTASLKASCDGQDIALGPKEFRILQKLVEQGGKIVSKEQLEDMLYSWGHEVESNIIEVHIYRIRKKLGSKYIKTIRGMGYMLEKSGDKTP